MGTIPKTGIYPWIDLFVQLVCSTCLFRRDMDLCVHNILPKGDTLVGRSAAVSWVVASALWLFDQQIQKCINGPSFRMQNKTKGSRPMVMEQIQE